MKLKELRKEKKLTQEDLSKFLNVSRATYNGYELNKYEPNIDTLCKLADYYNVTLDYLIGRETKTQFNQLDKELLNITNQLNDFRKGQVIGYAKRLLEEERQQIVASYNK